MSLGASNLYYYNFTCELPFCSLYPVTAVSNKLLVILLLYWLSLVSYLFSVFQTYLNFLHFLFSRTWGTEGALRDALGQFPGCLAVRVVLRDHETPGWN